MGENRKFDESGGENGRSPANSAEKDASNENAFSSISLEKSLRELRERLVLAIFADALLTFAIFAVFAGGFLLLICHATGVSSPMFERIVLGLCFVVPLLLASITLRRKRPSKDELITILAAKSDVSNSGLLASYGEIEMREWEEHAFSATVPTIKISYSRRPAILAMGIIFLFGSLAVPKLLPENLNRHGLDISADRNELEERIETMKEEELIEEGKAEELKRQLEEIAAGAEGEDPEKSWEALDHLSDKLDEQALEAEEETKARLEKINLVEAAANGVMKSAESETGDSELAMKGLEKLLKKLESLSPELKKMMGERGELNNMSDLKEALSKLGMTREELKRLLKKIRECESVKCRMAREGCESRGKGEGEGDGISMEELKAFVEANCSSEEAMALMACPFPGRGGISRGRGDAEMSWKQRELDFPHAFKSEKLNDASPPTMKDSVLVGRGSGAPKTGEVDVSAPGALTDARISSRDSSGFVVQPRYRGTVKSYFERKPSVGGGK